MDKFRKLWEPVDRVVFGTVRHLCELVLRTDEHLKVTMFDEKMKKGQIFATDVLATLCIIIFAVFMVIYGVLLMKQSRSNTMAGLNIPYAWMYLSLPVTGVLYIFALITQWTRRREA